MIRRVDRSRHGRHRVRPRYEILERRIALAGGGGQGDAPSPPPEDGASAKISPQGDPAPLSVVLVAPAPDFTLTAPPASLVLEFNHPILPDTIDSDVVVVRVDDRGDPIDYLAPYELTLDPSSTRLEVALPGTLPPGHHQVRVLGRSGIMDADGNYLTDGFTDLAVGQFDVTVPGITLDRATDLGAIGTAPMAVPGALDFQDGSPGVALYRVRIEPGHFWRLGLEVTAQRDGGTLDTALALFDAQGRVIGTDEVGREDFPKDPYLYAGLEPGIYFVGVSGVNNLPGPGGGYDPATGSAGAVHQTQDGGPYTLHLVADPADDAPRLVSFSVDRADPLSIAPTGLTLGFSRAIALAGAQGNLGPSLSRGIELRDEDGRRWPVEASGYDEAHVRISYLFEEPLPPGHYAVTLPEQGGLTDLAGLSPVAAGQPDATLARFDVGPPVPALNPFDYGALLPGRARDGVRFEGTPAGAGSDTYRFVVTVPGLYTLERGASDEVSSAQIAGRVGARSIDATGTNDTLLSPGPYTLRFQNYSSQAGRYYLRLRLAQGQTEIVLSNGVGQGPALSLRLISYPALSPLSPPWVGPLPVSLPASPSVPGHGGTSDLGGPGASHSPLRSAAAISPPVQGGGVSFLPFTTDLVGRPAGTTPYSASLAGGTSAETGGQGGGLARQALSGARGPTRRTAWRYVQSESAHRVTDFEPPLLPAQAAMVPLVVQGGMEILRRFLPSALRQARSLGSWITSWSGTLDVLEVGSGGAVSLIEGSRAESGQDDAQGGDDDDPLTEGLPWQGLATTPLVVTLSAATITHLSWRLRRWWRSRTRSQPAAKEARGMCAGPELSRGAIGANSRYTITLRPPLFSRSIDSGSARLGR